VLAAVDSHTGKHLVDHCLNGPLTAGRTVIMVSHHVELLLPSSDYLVRMLDGRVESHGTPEDLRRRGLLEQLIATEETHVKRDEPADQDDDIAGQTQVLEKGESHGDSAGKKARPGRKLVKDEERATGNVKLETYKTYIVASTWTVWIITLALLACAQLATNGERIWLKLWGSAYQVQGTSFAVMSGIWTESYPAMPHTGFAQQHFVTHQGQRSEHPKHSWLRLPSADSHPGYYLAGLGLINLASFVIGKPKNGLRLWSDLLLTRFSTAIVSTLNSSWARTTCLRISLK